MHKLQAVLMCLVILLATSCDGTIAANAPLIQPSRQLEATLPVASSSRPASTEPVPTPIVTSTPESACPPSMTIKAPSISRFDPIEGSGAIAYSGDGLDLVFPQTKSTIAVHSLTKLGLDGVDWNFVWSPNGTQIAFLYTDPRPEGCARGYLILADLSQGEVHPLTPAYAQYSRLAWSPDDEWLAFTDEAGHLKVMRVSSSEVLTISDQALGLSTPTWLDTEHVVYVRPAGDRSQADLVSQPLDRSAPRVLLKNVSQLKEFALSRDGRSMAYFGGALYLVDMRSGSMENLGLDLRERLQWSPDGEYLLGRGGMAGIYLFQPRVSTTVTQMSFLGLPGSQQTWAPDSRQFAVLIGPGDGLPSIGIYDVDTQTLEKLSVTVRFPHALAWSTR